jgi:hypothetical protein
MVTTESNISARESLLAEIRDAVAKTGRGTISMRKFHTLSGIKWHTFFKHFRSWAEALSAAGIESKPGHRRIDPTHLMEDCARVARHLGRMPSRREYTAHGNFNESTLSKACGGWGRVAPALRAFAAQRRQWADILEYLPRDPTPQLRRRRRQNRSSGLGATAQSVAGCTPTDIPCGPPLDFGPLRHEPTNEQGVIFLFGIMAEKLGFLIEGFQSTAFPDCKAKRLDILPPSSRERWRDIKIEFEYESRNFRGHAHDPKACDLIVCWNHNWPDCPVEVLALKDEAKKLISRPK